MKYVLSIAGSDSCGGAGIQADIKTISSLGAHALTAITAVTAQNSLGVVAIHEIPAGFISIQVETLIEDLFPSSVKVGMLPTGSAVKEVAGIIEKHRFERVVVDPVMRASTGRNLLDSAEVPVLKNFLLPLADVVTPNIYEAGILSDKKVRDLNDMEEAAKAINKLGPGVVITGGHLKGRCVDLFFDGKELRHFHGSRIETKNSHGSGCVFSTSLATFLTMNNDTAEAVRLAKDFTRHALKKGYPCGHGAGVVNPNTFNSGY